MVLVVKNPPANAGDAREEGLIPGLGRCLGGRNDASLQHPCLEEAWQSMGSQRVGHRHTNNCLGESGIN